MKPSHILSGLWLSLCLAISLLCSPQPSAIQTSMAADPPGTLDGSKDPGQITDSKAWEVFIMSTALLDNASDYAHFQSRSKFARAHLDQDDVVVVMTALHHFAASRASLEAAADRAVQKGATESTPNFYTEYQDLITRAEDEMRSGLSPEGLVRIERHIQHLKTRLKFIRQ